MMRADAAAIRPTGPRPTTATVSPGAMRPSRAPYQPVGALSVRTSAASSDMPSGIATRFMSAAGTATASAWHPPSAWPTP